jgi:anti-sigma regulatory factor (Ser/Thr protein kinase)
MKFAESNIVELAESVTKELQIKSDAKKIYLKVEGDAKKVPLTWCDPERIREVIVNLTGNAIKFTDKGGITISVTSDSNFIKIAVKDTGRGISAEGQKKLFQKFSQVNRAQDEHQGTGLGLYISKNFIELHNGKLSVQSEEGKGATFLIELPILKEAPKEVKGAVLENADSGLQVGPVDSKPGTTAPATTPADAKTTAPAVALAGAAKTETTTPKAETAVISKTEVAPAKESTSTTTSASMTGQNPLTLAPAVSSVESAGSSAKPSTGDTTKPVTGADPTPTKLEPAKEPEKPVHHETKVHHTAEKPASHPVKK